MSGYQQVFIGGYPGGGLMTDRKPFMLPDQAYSTLENAYVWRERTKKREGTCLVGQLQRVITTSMVSAGTVPGSSFSIASLYAITSPAIGANEPYKQVVPGSIVLTINGDVYTDNGDGFLFGGTAPISGAITHIERNLTTPPGFGTKITSALNGLGVGETVTITGVTGEWGAFLNGNTYTIAFIFDPNNFLLANKPPRGIQPYTGPGTWTTGDDVTNMATVNYVTSALAITTTQPNGSAITISYDYYPNLQVMGICKQDVAAFGIDQTIYFDTKYAYQYSSGNFHELATGTTWTGPNNSNDTNSFFFWSANYQGITPDVRLFFETNNNIKLGAATPYDPIRYYDGSWHDLKPLITATQTLFQGLIIIPYYGRLLILNTWEGLTSGGSAGATNFFSRCRFSQIGNPIGVDSWRTDIFGLGGFIDAPTNEAIVSAAFFRNTLIVFFEYSTWQLRYVGEYGLPFIFERISSDFGAVSTFSPIVFDQGVFAISDRGIIQAGASGVSRLDEQIPETVFSFQIQNNGPDFVHGIRDFQKELVYWNYMEAESALPTQVFPTKTLLYNYKNNSWAQFRDTITCFGIAQFQDSVTWDSLTTFWESEANWDNVDDQNYVDYVVSGNQQGFIEIYENQDASTTFGSTTNYAASLSIYAIVTIGRNSTLTVHNHNLNNGEIIYITGTLWSANDPGFNNLIYQVKVVDQNTITLSQWNGTNYIRVNFSLAGTTYIGGGLIALFPVMNIIGKDFNPFQAAGKQFKLTFIDFQMDTNAEVPSIPAVTIQLFINSYLGAQGNLLTGNLELANSTQPFGYITFVTTGAGANPCVVTSPNHSLQTGTIIYIANVLGTVEVNQGNYTITVIDANNFSLNGINATGFHSYAFPNTGTWNAQPTEGQSYTPGSQYAWFRFYSTQFGQYMRIAITYDAALMNQLATHQTPMELNAMNVWLKDGGRLIN